MNRPVIPTDAPDEPRQTGEFAVFLGGASVACWFCCPFWILVSVAALPLALAGLARARVEYRASAQGRTNRSRAVAGGALSLLGAAAAIVYLIFTATHPDLLIQD
ncbi:hypothetical protein F3K32_19885 [Streptomyces sp. LBUM 1483]|nr:hypothetical protein [Streptomyces sp. LBUM 1481]MBP5922499.1 hypothetical protein [Streptomyces sp. LBUM 1483]